MTQIPINPQQREAAIEILKAVATAIKDAGDAGIPSGELYALLMAKGISFEGYTKMIDGFKSAGMITNKGHLLRWVVK